MSPVKNSKVGGPTGGMGTWPSLDGIGKGKGAGGAELGEGVAPPGLGVGGSMPAFLSMFIRAIGSAGGVGVGAGAAAGAAVGVGVGTGTGVADLCGSACWGCGDLMARVARLGWGVEACGVAELRASRAAMAPDPRRPSKVTDAAGLAAAAAGGGATATG